MKTGRNLLNLAQEIERQTSSKFDVYAPTDKLEFTDDQTIRFDADGVQQEFEITNHAHGQIASRLNIPKGYYDRMQKEAPDLLAHNVNTWFRHNPEVRLVRTLDGSMRAFLSDRYRVLDNYDMMTCVLPIIQEKNLDLVSCEVTDKKLYLKAVIPSFEREITKSTRKGDIVQAGIVISNSEIGCGGLSVQSMLYYLACLNGQIMPTGIKKYHVGRRNEVEDSIRELLTDKTKKADDRAFWLKLQDITRASISREIFDQNVDIVEDAVDEKIEGDPVKVVENTQKRFGLTDMVGEQIMRNLIEGADLSKYGLMNAVTGAANNQTDYETATELERIGGKIVVLPKTEWEELAA